MDKEYLIHNIDCTDNPEDGHQTLDITISNLELDAPDMTATIGIDTFVNGMQASSNKYEDVSLTGAGGGGDYSTCTGTITDEGNLMYYLPVLAEIADVECVYSGPSAEGGEFQVVLYQGQALLLTDGEHVTSSGNITEIEENNIYLITGDFSATIGA